MGTISLALPREVEFRAVFSVLTLDHSQSWQEARGTLDFPCRKPLPPSKDPWRMNSDQTLGGYSLGPVPRHLGEESLLSAGFTNTLIIPGVFGIWSRVLFPLAPALKSHYLGHLSFGHICGSLSQISSSGRYAFHPVTSPSRLAVPLRRDLNVERKCQGKRNGSSF